MFYWISIRFKAFWVDWDTLFLQNFCERKVQKRKNVHKRSEQDEKENMLWHKRQRFSCICTKYPFLLYICNYLVENLAYVEIEIMNASMCMWCTTTWTSNQLMSSSQWCGCSSIFTKWYSIGFGKWTWYIVCKSCFAQVLRIVCYLPW